MITTMYDVQGRRTALIDVVRRRTNIDGRRAATRATLCHTTSKDVIRLRATLIDVVPAEGAVRTADGHWRLAREQRSIAGAAWFPEAGRGAIDPAVERWFLRGVARLHAAAPRATLIVFCLADCWMSWNAAWRLRRAGYRRVRWFAEGVDGWRDLGRPLVPITPYPEPL